MRWSLNKLALGLDCEPIASHLVGAMWREVLKEMKRET